MSFDIKHSDYPWLITIRVPTVPKIGPDNPRGAWRREFRRWMNEQNIESYWEGMTATELTLRVRTESDATLLKLRFA